MAGLYEEDILVWSERQSELLRRAARGERVNDPDLDWPHIIEEMEAVGRSELASVNSHLVLTLLHLLKVRCWPSSLAVPHWAAEARLFSGNARAGFAPSMRQRVDVADLYRRARSALPDTIDGYPPQLAPDACPWSLADLLDVTW